MNEKTDARPAPFVLILGSAAGRLVKQFFRYDRFGGGMTYPGQHKLGGAQDFGNGPKGNLHDIRISTISGDLSHDRNLAGNRLSREIEGANPFSKQNCRSGFYNASLIAAARSPLSHPLCVAIWLGQCHLGLCRKARIISNVGRPASVGTSPQPSQDVQFEGPISPKGWRRLSAGMSNQLPLPEQSGHVVINSFIVIILLNNHIEPIT
jgi:hypothetical protein